MKAVRFIIYEGDLKVLFKNVYPVVNSQNLSIIPIEKRKINM